MFELIQKKKKILCISIQFFAIYIAEFGIMLNRHYSIDSYHYVSHSTIYYKGQLLTARIGAYIIGFLLKDINLIQYEKIFTFFFIVILTVSATMLYSHLVQRVDNEKSSQLLLKLAVVVMFGNVYMVDFFSFPEALPSMSCGIFFMAIAIMQIDFNISCKRLIIMILCMIVAVNCYQAILGFFVFFSLANIYLINKGNLSKNAFKSSLKVLICGGVSGLSNVMLLRIFQSTGIIETTSRTEMVGISKLLVNVKHCASGAYEMFRDPWGFLPRYTLLIVLLYLYAFLILSLYKKKRSLQDYIYIFLFVVICRLVVFVPHLLSSDIWMAPRSIISYWSIVSIPCIILTVLVKDSNTKLLLNFAMGIFCVINMLSIQKIAGNIITTNRLDEEISYAIQNEIETYEEESGHEIKTILFKSDAIPSYAYRSTDFSGFELATKIYNVNWGCVEMLNYFNGRNYQYGLMDEEDFSRLFKKNNWDYLNLEEQLVFEGETAYFVSY